MSEALVVDPSVSPEALEPGMRVVLGGGVWCLEAPAHSLALSVRWCAAREGDGARAELLFVPPGAGGPMLSDGDAGGWGYVEGAWGEGWRVLVFDVGAWRALTEWSPSPNGRDGAQLAEMRGARLRALLAVGEALEIVHEVYDGLVCHAGLGAFVLRETEGVGLEAVVRAPELVHASDAPPRSGSFQGTGLDAPEVVGLISRPIDARADVFMLGMIAYRLLTGVRLGPKACAWVERLPPLRAFDAHVPLGLERCVRRALARAPEARHASVAALLEELRAVLASAGERGFGVQDRPVEVAWAARSVPGRGKLARYPVNQDAHVAVWDAEASWGVFAVLDGVSRCRVGSGERASWAAQVALERAWNVKRTTPIYGRMFDGDAPFALNVLLRVADDAHEAVVAETARLVSVDASPRSEPLQAMATTLTAVACFGDRAAVVSVGDSPAFVVRHGPTGAQGSGSGEEGLAYPLVERLNADQTALWQALRDGVTLGEAVEQPRAKALVQALGRARWSEGGAEEASAPIVACPLEAQGWTLRLHPGDVVVVCSDGVVDALGEEAFAALLVEETAALWGAGDAGLDAREAALVRATRRWLDAANACGGHDNLTVMALHIGAHVEVRGDDAGGRDMVRT